MRLRKVSTGNLNLTFSRDGEGDKMVDMVTNMGKSAEEMNKVAKETNRSVEEQEEMNTTYSLADVSLTRSGCKRKREEGYEKEKDALKRRSPRMRKPLLS